jgi:hypothetical protein
MRMCISGDAAYGELKRNETLFEAVGLKMGLGSQIWHRNDAPEQSYGF